MENEVKSVKVDIPNGYEIDTKKSDFKNGNIVFKQILTRLSDIIAHWDATMANSEQFTFANVSNFLKHYAPSVLYYSYIAIVLKKYFRDILVTKYYNGQITKGNYVIVNNEITLMNDIDKDSSVQKGSIRFGSFEEALFVDRMMKQNYDQMRGWSEL